MKLFISIVSCLLLIFFLFLNLGNYLDVSEEAKKSDVIFCLGGGYRDNRIKKAYSLFIKGYTKENYLVFTGSEFIKSKNIDARVLFLNNQEIKINAIHQKNLKNTKDEVLFIKDFMEKNNLKSAIIVSDKPHTRRIKTIIDYKISNENYSFTFVGSDLKWWNSNKYYKDKRSQVYAFYEFVKLLNAHFMYGFIEYFNLLDFYEKYVKEYIENFEKGINYISYQYLKN